jgi:hypothetical protein
MSQPEVKISSRGLVKLNDWIQSLSSQRSSKYGGRSKLYEFIRDEANEGNRFENVRDMMRYEIYNEDRHRLVLLLALANDYGYEAIKTIHNLGREGLFKSMPVTLDALTIGLWIAQEEREHGWSPRYYTNFEAAKVLNLTPWEEHYGEFGEKFWEL